MGSPNYSSQIIAPSYIRKSTFSFAKIIIYFLRKKITSFSFITITQKHICKILREFQKSSSPLATQTQSFSIKKMKILILKYGFNCNTFPNFFKITILTLNYTQFCNCGHDGE